MDKPQIILQKNAESNTNKIRLPKDVVKKMGNKFYMEVYDNRIVLKPLERRI